MPNVSIKIPISLALALIIILSSFTYLVPQKIQAQSTINAVTYDKWLTPCKCYGGTLKVAMPGEPTILNWFVAGATVELTLLEPIYDRLVRLINGTLTWELATSMEYSLDYKTLTIKIRSGVKWHDGKELTADDVAFTINVLANKSWTYYHAYYVSVDKAVALDKNTTVVYFKKPDAGFILNALTTMNVLPKHVWEPLLQQLGDGLAKYSPKPSELIGSGPFKFVEYVPGQYVKYSVNKEYWLGRPCVDEILVVFIKETQVQILALQKGDVDTISLSWVTPEVVPQLLAMPNVGVHIYTSDTFYHWGLNNKMWPFNITEFRRALAYAVDKESIIRDVLMGYGLPGSPGVVPPVGPNAEYYNPNVAKAYTFNMTKAAELLDKLGFKDVDGDGFREAPDGSKFEFEIYAPSYDIIRVRIAQILSEQLSRIPGGGLKVIPRVVDWTAVWPMIREGKIQTWLLGSEPGTDISWLFTRFHTRETGGSGNWAWFSDPEVDRLTELLRTTFDPVKRKEYAWRVQEILAEKVPIITLYYRRLIVPYRTDRFDNWFKPSNGEPYNRITYLRAYTKLEKCPLPPATTTLVTTVTQPPATVVTTLITSAVSELTPLTILIPVAVLVAFVLGLIAFLRLRRK